MALHMLRPTPPFTKVMRGYDPEEVDEHLRSLDAVDEDHAEAAEVAERRAGMLAAELDVMRRRVEELESSIRTETPRTIAAFGERLTMVLGEAEDAAQASLAAARDEAAMLVAEARMRADDITAQASAVASDAESRAAARLALAEDRAVTVEASAARRAGATMDEAETWARNRRVEVEGWAADIRAHIDAERAREAEQFARVRAARTAELVNLARRRDAVVDELDAAADGIRRTVVAARAAAATADAPDSLPVGRSPELVRGAEVPAELPGDFPERHVSPAEITGSTEGVEAGPSAVDVQTPVRPFDAEVDLTGPLELDAPPATDAGLPTADIAG